MYEFVVIIRQRDYYCSHRDVRETSSARFEIVIIDLTTMAAKRRNNGLYYINTTGGVLGHRNRNPRVLGVNARRSLWVYLHLYTMDMTEYDYNTHNGATQLPRKLF